MSYKKGFKNLFSGILKRSDDNSLSFFSFKDSKKIDHGSKSDKIDPSSSSSNAVIVPIVVGKEDPKPANSLKRKETTVFKPVELKDKEVAMDAPASPSYSAPSLDEPSTTRSSSTITTGDPNRPAVHYFRYDSVGPHGDPNVRKLLDEITIAGFNDEATEEQLDGCIDDPPFIKYKIPRLYMTGWDEILDKSNVTSRSASGYVDQVKNKNPTGITTHSNNPADRMTMGSVNIENNDADYFFLGPDDLIIMEPIGTGFYDGGIPWAGHDHNVFPFAHPKYFDNSPLKNFAWEWVKHTEKAAYRPLHAIPGVQLWLIDYDLKRHPRHRRQTDVKGPRQVFYGRGVRFVEVKSRDEEWMWDETRHFTALKQLKLWKEKKKGFELFEDWDPIRNWPKVGVLACEVDED